MSSRNKMICREMKERVPGERKAKRQISQLGNLGDEKNTNKRERQQERGNAKERGDIRNKKVKKGCTNGTSRDENFTDKLSIRPALSQRTRNCLNWYVGYSIEVSATYIHFVQCHFAINSIK